MADTSTIPKRVFFFWAQGIENAPPLAKMVWSRWKDLHPNYDIEILDLSDAREVLSHLPLDFDTMSPTGISDILRLELIGTRGGIWSDSSVIASRHLDTWMPEAGQSGFFAFKWNERIRPLSNWFMAAQAGSPAVMRWRAEVAEYLQIRRPLNPDFTGHEALTDAAYRSMGYDGEARAEAYPYFWSHFIFAHLLQTDPEVQAVWNKTPEHSSKRPHMLDRYMRADGLALTSPNTNPIKQGVKWAISPLGYRAAKIRSLLQVAPVHKLSFKRTYRAGTIRALERAMDQIAPPAG